MASKVIRNVTKIRKVSTNTLAGRVTSGTGPAEELTATQARTLLSVYTTAQVDSALAGKVDSSSLSESIDDRVAALLVAGTNITITYNDAAGTLTVASTAGGLSGTGSVDNAALRADGTGGATLQNSDWIINDNLTASPNNTVNHACLEATGGTTNVSVSIKPKGSGAFCLAAPDGTTTGGNARGANAIDLQTARSAATQVASGSQAILIGANSTASGPQSIMIGHNGTAGDYSIAIGRQSATGSGAIGIGNELGNASANGSIAIGSAAAASSGACSIALGGSAIATQANEIAFGCRLNNYGSVAWQNNTKLNGFQLACKTTNATPTALALTNVFATANLSVSSGFVFSGLLRVVGVSSTGDKVAIYNRLVSFKNVGGTITLLQNTTIGTDYEDDALTDLTIANTSPFFTVTGISGETWRWFSAWFPSIQIAYGT